jgi:hypothetical protein
MRRRSLLHPLAFALGLSLALAGTVSARVGTDNVNVTANKYAGYYEWRDTYPGGDQSLPYGQGDAREVLDHAGTMASVSYAASQLVARGYIRRPDGDVAGTQNGFSFAALAFEKAGRSIDEAEPILVVATRAVEIPDIGYRAATQLYSALFRDSAHVVVIDGSPGDSAIGFEGDLMTPPSALTRGMNAALGGAPTHIDQSDENFVYRYCAYDEPHGTWQYRNTMSPGMQYLMSQAYAQTDLSALGGAIVGFANGYSRAGVPGGITGALLSGYAAGVVAWNKFWLSPPDTNRVGR